MTPSFIDKLKHIQATTYHEKKHACPYCGASMLEHKHNLARPLVVALDRLFTQFQQQPINIRHLNLSRTLWDNFQKLSYFGLVNKHYLNTVRVPGEWYITNKGVLFLLGKIPVHRAVWTYRGEVVQRDSKKIFVDQVIEGFKTIHDYQQDSRPH